MDRHECLSSTERSYVSLGGEVRGRIFLEPAALRGGHVGKIAGEELGERLDFSLERNLHDAVVGELRELRVVADGDRLASFERADQRPRGLAGTGIAKVDEAVDRGQVRRE